MLITPCHELDEFAGGRRSLTVNQIAGTVVILITDDAMAGLGAYRTVIYDVKVLLADGSSQS